MKEVKRKITGNDNVNTITDDEEYNDDDDGATLATN